MPSLPIDPEGELPLEEIMAAFKEHRKAKPLIFLIKPTHQTQEGEIASAIPAPQQKIFPGGILQFDDFSQGNLGNCYMVSAINSILIHEQGAKVLAGCIKDLTTLAPLLGQQYVNHVIVRVFSPYLDIDIKSPTYNTDKLAVGYMIFEKSVFNTIKRAKGFPLMQLLEQAHSLGNNIMSLEGGTPASIHERILGDYASEQITLKTKEHSEQFYHLPENNYKGTSDLYLTISCYHSCNPHRGIRSYRIEEIFRKLKQNHLNELLKIVWPKPSDTKETQLQNLFQFASLARQLSIYKTDKEARECIDLLIDFGQGIIDPSYYSKYNENASAQLNEIGKNFDLKKSIIFDSYVKSADIESYAKTKEAMAKGMLGSHTYCVIGNIQEKVISAEKHFFIPVHNPWGRDNPYGVEYQVKNDLLLPISSNNSSFLLEFNHALQTINTVHFSHTPIVPETPGVLSQRALSAIKDKSTLALNSVLSVKGDLAPENIAVSKSLFSKQASSNKLGLASIFSPQGNPKQETTGDAVSPILQRHQLRK